MGRRGLKRLPRPCLVSEKDVLPIISLSSLPVSPWGEAAMKNNLVTIMVDVPGLARDGVLLKLKNTIFLRILPPYKQGSSIVVVDYSQLDAR